MAEPSGTQESIGVVDAVRWLFGGVTAFGILVGGYFVAIFRAMGATVAEHSEKIARIEATSDGLCERVDSLQGEVARRSDEMRADMHDGFQRIHERLDKFVK